MMVIGVVGGAVVGPASTVVVVVAVATMVVGGIPGFKIFRIFN